ncbi:MAG: glycosyltransferase family 4 protein [Pyrinomonadaceae bacterium MAG19_C2-C3]|nr:glycosyltransferase family 4 protein [Pyrinomonadaceae bacterium MAG19_C2-C3]
MRVLALVPGPFDVHPSQRFRIEQWERRLRQHFNVDIDFSNFIDNADDYACLHQPGNNLQKATSLAGAFVKRMREMKDIRQYDLVFVGREAASLGPPVFENWIARCGVPLVYDFDDAIFHPHIVGSQVKSLVRYALHYPPKTRALCRLATHVIAGNDYLAEFAKRFNKHVTVIPTTIETTRHTVDESKRGHGVPVIGWTGSFSTVQDLEGLRGALLRLREHEAFQLHVIGAPHFEMHGIETRTLEWRAATEIEDLQVIDIGIMPLSDNQWTRGKCGLKVLQYMALGIPSVCSPVGVNTKIIRDGENGFLARTEGEWVEKLTSLLRSAQLRRRLGCAGRQSVEANYSAEVQVPRVFQVFRSATQ